MTDPFELLGIPARYDLDLDELATRQRDLSRALHPDRYAGRGASERRQALGKAIEVNEAARLLKDPVKRAELLLERHGIAVGEGVERQMPGDFLMEIMELREQLGDLRRARDMQGVEALCERVRARQQQVTERLQGGFRELLAGGSGAKSHPPGEQLLPLVAELRYYARFFAEAHAILDDFG